MQCVAVAYGDLEDLQLLVGSTSPQYTNDFLIASLSKDVCHSDLILSEQRLAENGHKASQAKL